MIMATSKRTTKKELEAKIAKLEAKVSQLSAQLETKPAPKPAKPAEQARPAETKPAEPASKKERGSLPKGFEQPAAEKAPPAEPEAGSLEHAYANAAMTDFHDYRTKVTGYAPAPNRYFVRRTAPVGKVATASWHEQKAKVTGYTQPSNQYFATRARLAYHPPEKAFTGYDISFGAGSAQTQTQTTPPEPKKTRGTLPKGF